MPGYRYRIGRSSSVREGKMDEGEMKVDQEWWERKLEQEENDGGVGRSFVTTLMVVLYVAVFLTATLACLIF